MSSAHLVSALPDIISSFLCFCLFSEARQTFALLPSKSSYSLLFDLQISVYACLHSLKSTFLLSTSSSQSSRAYVSSRIMEYYMKASTSPSAGQNQFFAASIIVSSRVRSSSFSRSMNSPYESSIFSSKSKLQWTTREFPIFFAIIKCSVVVEHIISYNSLISSATYGAKIPPTLKLLYLAATMSHAMFLMAARPSFLSGFARSSLATLTSQPLTFTDQSGSFGSGK